MKSKLLLTLLACTGSFLAQATILPVPGSYATIRQAVNASSDGDTVLVAPGTYYENINFNGRNIVLTSMYYLSSDTSFIASTIINGSMPSHPDTGSCVIFSSGEDSTAVLQGFTITAGTGTKWLDIHGAGTYREGGGVLIELSSPTVRYNVITGNAATNTAGVTSAGGGAIRIGDGFPEISNNVIVNNQARYGAGIVLNYTGVKLRNNIIANNTGGQDYYGGSAIWITSNLAGFPKIIENNTIINNSSSLSNGTGGISVWSASNVEMKNNIIYNNLPVVQIKTISSMPQVSYSNIQGGFNGISNIDTDPMLATGTFLLLQGSPCIDSGDPDISFEELEDGINPGNALFPSMGTITCDMGAYGGPGARVLPTFAITTGISNPASSFSATVYPNPFNESATIHFETELQDATLLVYDIMGKEILKIENISGDHITLPGLDLSAGLYTAVIMKKQIEIFKHKISVIHPN